MIENESRPRKTLTFFNVHPSFLPLMAIIIIIIIYVATERDVKDPSNRSKMDKLLKSFRDRCRAKLSPVLPPFPADP